jgi:hypothetical protein
MTDEASIMGLHASYRPISQTMLDDFIARWHSEDFWKRLSRFREESNASGREFYIGTEWHVSAEEAHVIAQLLPLIDQSEFDSRFAPRQMKGVYRAPIPGKVG